MWSQYADYSPWNERDWTIDRKVPQELSKSPFNGSIEEWADWRNMARNHLLTCNQGYGRIVFEVEQERAPLTFQRLANQGIVGMNVNHVDH